MSWTLQHFVMYFKIDDIQVVKLYNKTVCFCSSTTFMPQNLQHWVAFRSFFDLMRWSFTTSILLEINSLWTMIYARSSSFISTCAKTVYFILRWFHSVTKTSIQNMNVASRVVPDLQSPRKLWRKLLHCSSKDVWMLLYSSPLRESKTSEQTCAYPWNISWNFFICLK